MDMQAMKPPSTKAALDDLMEFVSFVNEFRAIEHPESGERMGGRSYRLAMQCWFMNHSLELELDDWHVGAHALAHGFADFPGTKAWKERFPEFFAYAEGYRTQRDREARFVREVCGNMPSPACLRMRLREYGKNVLPAGEEFAVFVHRFSVILRTIWFAGVAGKEMDGEHCFQLALVVWFLNQRLELGLDTGRLVFYALVHDLVEVYAGDTPAFAGPNSTYALRHNDKEEREAAALERIDREWGERFPDLVRHIEKYNAQRDKESRLVYAADKLVSAMNVVEDGGRSWHKLGETLEHVLAYKLPKVQRHPAIAELFDELVAMLEASPHLFPRPNG